MTIKMLMGEQFQPLGPAIQKPVPVKADPVMAFESGDHQRDGEVYYVGNVYVDGQALPPRYTTNLGLPLVTRGEVIQAIARAAGITMVSP